MGGFSAITIERQYASGGSEIGRLLSEALGIECHDHEILDMALDRLGLNGKDKALAGLADETTEGALDSLSRMRSRLRGDELSLAEKVFNEEAKIISLIASERRSVFVGRCSGYILKTKVRSLNVYIYADHEKRFDRAWSVYGVPVDDVDDVIKRYDKRRGDFYLANTKNKWDDRENYHICLNSGMLGIKTCADIIAELYKNGC